MPLSPDVIANALGLTVVHFVWQGAAIGLGAFVGMRLARRSAPQARYLIGCIALAGCLLSFAATFVFMLPSATSTPALTTVPDVIAALAAIAEPSEASAPSTMVRLVAWAWGAGVLLLFVRTCVQWMAARRLRTDLVATPSLDWQSRFEAIRDDLGVRRAIRMVETSAAEVPMVIGWLSPIVLVPTSAFLSLTPEQLRAVLAHELAHVRRHDHLVNCVQTVIETVLFFHPVVWWLSNEVRVEREHCCDDIAVRATGSSHALARALTTLESLRVVPPQAALAANGGPLMDRISRLLGTDRRHRTSVPRWRTVAAMTTGVLVTVAGLAHASRPTPPDDVSRVLRDAVSLGMDEAQARQIYDAIVLPGSDSESEVAAKLVSTEVLLRDAIDAGKLSAAEAEAKLDHVTDELRQHREIAFATQILGLSEADAYMRMVTAEHARLVQAGTITAEEAALKTERIARTVEAKTRLHEFVEQASRELREEVESGMIDPRAARERLHLLKEDAEKRLWVETTGAEIEAAVHEGRLTREEADEKHHLIQRRVRRDQRMTELHRRLLAERSLIEMAVENDVITREEAARSFEQLRRDAAVEHGDLAAAAAHEQALLMMSKAKAAQDAIDWDVVRQRLGSAVERGEMTREAAESAMRALQANRPEADPPADDARVDRYRALQEQLREALAAGRITPEDAERRLIEARRRLFSDR